MQERTEFYVRQLTEVLATRAHEYEARWLPAFGVGVRDVIEPQFDWAPDGPSVKDDCNYLHPNALTAFNGGNVRQVEGYAFEDFARGAATVASVFHKDDADRLGDLIKMQMETMHQRALSYENPYPSVAERLFPIYASCATLILLSNEHTTWQALLAYTLGFIWVLGLVRLDDRQETQAIESLFATVKRGTYY